MTISNSRAPVLFALFLLGIGSQFMQAWLARETLVIFYGNEVSLGAFFGSWLFWIALGSLAIFRLQRYRWVEQARRGLAGILLLLPVLLAFQILAVRGVRLILDIPSVELVPLGQLFPAVIVLTLPVATALGLAFPLACKALGESEEAAVVRGISRLYVVEAAGALAGGVLFTFVILPWLGLWPGLGSLALAAAVTAWWLLPLTGMRLASGLLAALGLSILVTPLGEAVDTRLESFRFGTLQPGLELLDALETRYGHVAYARLGDQVSVVRDGRIATSFPQPSQVQQTAAYVYSQAAGARRVLLFGDFASGLATELLRYPLQGLDVVLQDRQAFDHLQGFLPDEARASLQDPRLQLHFTDGRRYLREYSGAHYDLVLVLDTSPSNAHSNRYFTREFYANARMHMAAPGVLCTRVSSASNYLGGAVRSYAGSIFRTLHAVFDEVAVQPGDVQTFCASAQPGRVSEDPAELARRYNATELGARPFPSGSFFSLLPPTQTAYLRHQYQAFAADINSDARPVTFYLNTLLWARYTASSLADGLAGLRNMAAWPYLVPVAVFLLLWPLRTALEAPPPTRMRRRAGSFALALLGLVAMALQIVVLFGYQAHVGFMFERIALINALFMTGLALGTGLLGQYLARRGRAESWLIALLLLVALVLTLTPGTLAWLGGLSGLTQEAGYLALSGLFGLLTGVGFPLGVRLAQRDLNAAAPTGGVSEAADSLGGALGGLLTGALLVPLLGEAGTCKVLALLALAAMLPLAYARWMPNPLPLFADRGMRAFPWSGLGWSLLFLVLVSYGWSLALRDTEPPPWVKFDTSLLERVSGSIKFEARESPYPYYLGWDKPPSGQDAPADSASLSTLTVASQVRGYAGPVNLLLAVDNSGHLRGVRYLHSNETPSYIAGIATWLSTLTGLDLSEEPLDLQRVDAISGATVSSQAAIDSINKAVGAIGQTAFGQTFAASAETVSDDGALWTPGFLATLALLLAAIPIYLSGNEPARLGLLGASLGVLGLWLNTLVTEIDLINLMQGHFASLTQNPQRWLLLGFVGLSGLLFGQLWCGYLCPFGAAQEFVSRLGRRFGLRRYLRRPLDTRLRFLKFVLLALMLLAVLLLGDAFWATFNPMQHVFSGDIAGWIGGVLALSLLGAVFYFRFWCRYFCPFGAFLALSNKVALLQRFAPKRRFEHCDLGVHHEFDIDCIRCNRCLSASDTHIHRTQQGK